MQAAVLARLVGASVMADTARRFGALTASGLFAAIVVGSCAAARMAEWIALILTFSYPRRRCHASVSAAKLVRSGDRMAKTGARDAIQVLANGGMLCHRRSRERTCRMARGDAVMATAATGRARDGTGDTWATEVGMLASAAALDDPWSGKSCAREHRAV